jgi:transposase InsO family protein
MALATPTGRRATPPDPTATPSPRPTPAPVPDTDVDPPQPRPPRISTTEFLEDPYFGPIFALLNVDASARPNLIKTNPKWAHSLSRLQHFTIIDGQLHNYGHLGDTALCVPDVFPNGPHHPSLRTVLIQSVHDPPDQGHRGTDITYTRLRRRYYWRGMREATDRYVRSCTCQSAKSRTTTPYGLLQTPSQPLGPWTTITMDLLTKLVPCATTKHDTLLVVVDKCTKYTVLIPCCESITGPDTIALLRKHIFSKFGYPLQVISDRDPRWTGHFFQHWCTSRGIKHSMSSGNHPETDGQTERANRSIEEIARNYVQYDHGLFFELLDDLEFAINDSPTKPTGRSPFQQLFGFNPLRPNDLHGPPPTSAHRDTQTRLEHQHALRLEATDLYREAASRNTTIANRSRRAVPTSFQPGTLVWVHRDYITPPVRRQQQRVSGTGKLYPRYYGPYPITRAIGSASFELKLPATFKCHPVFHASALKASEARDDAGLAPASVTPLFDELGHELFEIEALLDRRVRNYKTVTRTTYLVKWRFYDLDEASWEPQSSIPPEFVTAYDRTHPR